MTQLFSSEEIFSNKNGLKNNLNHYNNMANDAQLSFEIENNIILTGGSHISLNKEDECRYLRKVSMGMSFVIYDRDNSKNFILIRLDQVQINNLYKILKLEKLKAFL